MISTRAISFRYVLSFVLIALLCSTIEARTVEGIEIKEVESFNDQNYVLNGTGLREASFFKIKVYVAALYLKHKTNNALDILDSNSAKILKLHFLHKTTVRRMKKAWTRGVSIENEEEAKIYNSDLTEFLTHMRELRKGDRLTLIFQNSGLLFWINSNEPSFIKSSILPKTLLTLWLGDNPPNVQLKNGLLGN